MTTLPGAPPASVRILAVFATAIGIWPTLAAFALAGLGGWSTASTVEFVLIGLAGLRLLVTCAQLAAAAPVRRGDVIASGWAAAWLAVAAVGFFFGGWMLSDSNGGTA